MDFSPKNADLISDEEIIALYWQRDERAIKKTDLKYGQYLNSIAYSILKDKDDCEECLNDTFVGAWNAMPPQKPTLLKAFLSTIMRRIALNRYKANRRQKRIVSELTVSLSSLDYLTADESYLTDIEIREISRVIAEFVHSLPPRRMYIFMSRYYIFRPIDEIAKLLGCSKSTVDKEIATIKRDMREKFGKEGFSI